MRVQLIFFNADQELVATQTIINNDEQNGLKNALFISNHGETLNEST